MLVRYFGFKLMGRRLERNTKSLGSILKFEGIMDVSPHESILIMDVIPFPFAPLDNVI